MSVANARPAFIACTLPSSTMGMRQSGVETYLLTSTFASLNPLRIRIIRLIGYVNGYCKLVH